MMEGGTVVDARAPGKVILSGEHAVVHGTAAVAAALGLYTTTSIRLRPLSAGIEEVCVLDLPELNVHFKWPLKVLKEILKEPGQLEPRPSVVKAYSESELPKLAAFVESQLPSDASKGAEAAVTSFLFLYASILGLQPTTVRVESELPVGAGLGSSASYCVSLAAALLALAGELNLPQRREIPEQENGLDREMWVDVNEEKLDLVNKWAFEGERIIHGRPSGIDNTVSSYGYVVRFKQGELTRLHTMMPLRMLLTNTQVGRNTKSLVAGVGERALRHPAAMAAIFNAIDEIAEEVVSIMQSPLEEVLDHLEGDYKKGLDTKLVSSDDFDATNVTRSKEEVRLEELVEMNQGLLQSIGVGHLSIEAICQITSAYKLRSKLTGAGGGGCVLTLLPHKMSATHVELVKVDLEGEGYSCFEAVIGGNGVQVSSRTEVDFL